jgi:hypothetical protein
VFLVLLIRFGMPEPNESVNPGQILVIFPEFDPNLKLKSYSSVQGRGENQNTPND